MKMEPIREFGEELGLAEVFEIGEDEFKDKTRFHFDNKYKCSNLKKDEQLNAPKWVRDDGICPWVWLTNGVAAHPDYIGFENNIIDIYECKSKQDHPLCIPYQAFAYETCFIHEYYTNLNKYTIKDYSRSKYSISFFVSRYIWNLHVKNIGYKISGEHGLKDLLEVLGYGLHIVDFSRDNNGSLKVVSIKENVIHPNLFPPDEEPVAEWIQWMKNTSREFYNFLLKYYICEYRRNFGEFPIPKGEKKRYKEILSGPPKELINFWKERKHQRFGKSSRD